MRPGPDVAALAGPVAVGVRVDSSHGGCVLAGDIPVWDVKFEATSSRTVPSKVTFSAPPDMTPTSPRDPLNNWGQRVLLSSIVESAGIRDVIPFGQFLITEWEYRGDSVEVTAMDLMQVISDNPPAWPSSPPAGARLSTELRRLAGSPQPGAGLPVVFEATDREVPRNTQYGTDRVESISDLCQTYGLLYAVKSDGCLHVWDEPRVASPVATYSTTDLVLEVGYQSRSRVPNQFIVSGSPNGDDGIKWTSTATNFVGNYDPALYGVLTARREFNAATSAEDVSRAAQTYMRKALAVPGTVTLRCAFDPRLELGDDINVIHERDEGIVDIITGRVTALSATLDDPRQTMRVDVKELLW